MISKEKLVEIMKDTIKGTDDMRPFGIHSGIVDENSLPEAADRILAALKEHPVASQPQDGLREELERYIKILKDKDTDTFSSSVTEARAERDLEIAEVLVAILSRHPSSTGESLAELMVRKDYGCVKISQPNNLIAKWLIEFNGYPPYAGIYAETYAECEVKAVAFLNTLPDTKGGK